MSALVCGCDEEAKWVCAEHRVTEHRSAEPRRGSARSRTTGKRIVGTADTLPATARILRGTFTRDGAALDFDYEGESVLCWDNQKTRRRDGVRVFQDEDGDDVLETDIEIYEEEDE